MQGQTKSRKALRNAEKRKKWFWRSSCTGCVENHRGFFFRRQSPAKTNELAIKLALDCDAMLVELLRSGRRSEDVIQYRSGISMR
jgi:hypothetical protein